MARLRGNLRSWRKSVTDQSLGGDHSSNCGASSPMTFQLALDPTKIWPATRGPGSTSSVPAGTRTRSPPDRRCGVGEPHILQKKLPQPDGVRNSAIWFSPVSQTNRSARILSTAFEPVPDTRRHSEQWHIPTGGKGPCTSYRTAPQRQPPVAVWDSFASAIQVSPMRRQTGSNSATMCPGATSRSCGGGPDASRDGRKR